VNVDDAPYGSEVLQANTCVWLSSQRIPIDMYATYTVRGTLNIQNCNTNLLSQKVTQGGWQMVILENFMLQFTSMRFIHYEMVIINCLGTTMKATILLVMEPIITISKMQSHLLITG
jgi:hypothetical protein